MVAVTQSRADAIEHDDQEVGVSEHLVRIDACIGCEQTGRGFVLMDVVEDQV